MSCGLCQSILNLSFINSFWICHFVLTLPKAYSFLPLTTFNKPNSINLLSVESNEAARYVYNENSNNLWIKETIQNTLNSIQEDNNPKCIFCGGDTTMEFVKDSKGGHEALICTKCNKFQNSAIVEDNSVQSSKNIDDIVDELANKILALPKGTEISISSLLGEQFKNYNTNEMFEINKRVLSVCREKGIVFNFDKYKDQVVGLPFNIPFIIE